MTSPLKCIDCPKSAVYLSEDELEAHIAVVHIKMLPYRCQLCKYGRLPTEYALTSHYSKVHDTTEFTMSVSSSNTLRAQRKELEKKLKKSIEASNSPGILPPKMNIHTCENSDETACGPVKCLDCSEEFQSKEKLEAHIADVHLNSMPYACEVCKHTMFPTEHILRRHHHEDHSSNQFNMIMQCSPEIVMERNELARRLELCLASSSRRSIDPLRSDRSPTTRVRMDSPSKSAQGATGTEVTASAEQPLASQQPSSVSSVRASPGKLPSSSGPEPQTPGASTPVPLSKALTTSAEQPLGISTAVTSGSVVSSVRPRSAVGLTVAPVQQESTSGDRSQVRPSRSVNRSIKREAAGGSSGPSAKRAPGTPQVKAEAPAASLEPRYGVKVEDVENQLPAEQSTIFTPNLDLVKLDDSTSNIGTNLVKIEDSDEPSTSSRTVYDAAWPLPFPLRMDEPEEAQDSDQEEQVEQEEEENDSENHDEREENIPKNSRERKSCAKQNFKCRLCSITVAGIGSTLSHACVHGKFLIFECKKCDKKFHTYNSAHVKGHIKRKHGITGQISIWNNIKDHREAMKAEISKMREKCFPKK